MTRDGADRIDEALLGTYRTDEIRLSFKDISNSLVDVVNSESVRIGWQGLKRSGSARSG